MGSSYNDTTTAVTKKNQYSEQEIKNLQNGPRKIKFKLRPFKEYINNSLMQNTSHVGSIMRVVQPSLKHEKAQICGGKESRTSAL